jgi:hypothetical protein
MAAFTRRYATFVAVGTAGIGFVLSLALVVDVVLSSGLWYPVIYAGAPAIAATATFASERPGTGVIRLLGVGAWLLASSVLALAAAVAFSVGATPSPGSAMSPILFGLSLYLGFLFVPYGLAVAAARSHGVRTVLLLALSPAGQAAIAWVLIAAL